MIILAILLPPLAVFMASHNPVKAGINLLLTLCLWIPGVIHALMIVSEEKNKKVTSQMADRIEKSTMRAMEAQAEAQAKAGERVNRQ